MTDFDRDAWSARNVQPDEPVFLFEMDGAEEGERRQVYVLARGWRDGLAELVARGEGNPRLVRFELAGERDRSLDVIAASGFRPGDALLRPSGDGPVDPAVSHLIRRPVRTIAFGVFLGLLAWAVFVAVFGFLLRLFGVAFGG